METFAGVAEHTDYEVGRLVAQLEDRSNKITAELVIPASRANGAILSQGGRFGGGRSTSGTAGQPTPTTSSG